MQYQALLPFLLLLFSTSPAAVQADTVNIYQLPIWHSLRTCVQDCVYTVSKTASSSFGCGRGNPATCMCSDNVQQYSVISSKVSVCAKSGCSNNQDASSAVVAFNQFCSLNSAGPADVLASPTGGDSEPTSGAGGGGAATVAPKTTATNNEPTAADNDGGPATVTVTKSSSPLSAQQSVRALITLAGVWTIFLGWTYI